MRKVILLALVMLLATMTQAQGDPAVAAADWLESQQAEDGSFSGGDADLTSAAAISLALLERPNEAAVAYLETFLLENQDTISLDTVSTIILAAVANGVDPTTFADGAALEKHGEMLRQARGEDMSDLCFGLIAMSALGAELPPTAVAGLKALQNEDGGFGAAQGQDSQAVYTATCLHVLVTAGETEAVEAAVSYLESSMNEDGGWSTLGDTTSDGFGTGFTLLGLIAAGEELMADWSDSVTYLLSQQDSETGEVTSLPAELAGDQASLLNVAGNAAFVMVFRGLSYNDVGAGEASASTEESAFSEGPALDANWAAIADGFGMAELDTADDFFVTVIDPFTNEELYGVDIINWTAEYQYTGYIIEQYLPAEVLLYLNEQDPTTFETISDAALQLLPDEVVAELPEALQARAGE